MVLQALYDFVFVCADEDILRKTQFGHPYIPLAIVVFYILFCKWIGPYLMKDRKPFVLRNVLIFYNCFQMLANAYITYHMVDVLYDFWDIRCLRSASPKYESLVKGRMIYNWHMYLIKYIDLLDAVFFVLRKKNKQITFLHLFHHAAICFFYYTFISTMDIGYYVLVTIGINCVIHIIMYLYYFLAAFGPHMQKYLWWKKYLTTMQMIQFVIVLIYMSVNFAIGCEKLETLEIAFFFFILALLLLFANFYRKSFKTE